MFQFLRRRPKDAPDPLQTHRTALAWLRQLPTNDAIGRQQHVQRAFEDFGRSGAPIDPGRLAAIEALDAELAPDRGQLLRQYVENAESSSLLADRIWTAAYECSQGFIGAYRRILAEAATQAHQGPWKRVLPRLYARLLHFYGTDAKLRVLRNDRWIPAKWVELHELYQGARKLGIEHTPLERAAHAEDAPRTVEQEYIAVLLTHLLNIGTLSPAEMDWAGGRLRAWSRSLKLESRPRLPGGFCVDVAGRSGLVRRAGRDKSVQWLYLDTTPLAEEIEVAIAASRESDVAEQDPAGVKARQRASTLEKLRPAFAPDVQTSFGRGPRVRRSHAADLRTGLARICQEAAFRQGDADVLASPREVVTFEATGGAGGMAAAPNDADSESVAVVLGNEPGWRVEDRSVGGMRIKGPVHGTHGMALGSLIAVGEPGVGDWVLGIVRRLTRGAAEIEAGIGVIARGVVVVPLNVKRQARDDMRIVVDGIDVSTVGAHFDGLYLPPPSRPDHPIPDRSLIIPTTEYAEGRQLVLITGDTVYTLALRQVIEQRPEWTWAVMEIVERATRDAATS